MRNRDKTGWVVITVLLSVVSFAIGAEQARKVVVLGFDGADPNLVRKYMGEGRLPNLKRLAEEGTFKDLTVTNPPQTPVSWAAFITGANPGRNHIFDFLIRDPKTYKPRFALMAEGSRRFLLGRWNRWVLPLVPAAAVLVAWIAACLIRRRTIAGAGLAVAGALALAAYAGGFAFASAYLPSRLPWPVNNMRGEPFWETAAQAGKRCIIFRIPDTFPAGPYPEGRLLSGLGVPDMRGRVGTPYVFTNDPLLTAGDNEFSVEIVQVSPDPGEAFETTILGPFNRLFYDYPLEDVGDGSTDPTVRDKLKGELQKKLEAGGVPRSLTVPLTLNWDREGGACAFEVQGQSGSLKPREWSPWVTLTFSFNRFIKVTGMARFYLLASDPYLRLYMSPLHFHPRNPDWPISYPRDYALKLMERFGPYKTMGWAEDTWTVSSGLADEEQFLSDMYLTLDAYQAMMRGLVKDGDWDLYVQVFEFTDRVGHILWQHMDPRHPLYSPERSPRYQEEMAKAYARMDTIVGEARATLPPDAALIVLSDHGFTSFRRAVNYNRWLVDNGYMALKEGTGIMTLEDLFDDDRLLFKNVDWSRTRAYGLGLGNVYVNLKGREREGIVEPGAEYEALLAELKAAMPQMVDPETGERPVHAVYTRDDLYRGYDPDLTPDLRVTNPPGYRVSWQTSLGGVPEALLETNLKAWSGDHCSMDPSFIPGMFFSNLRFEGEPDMLDLSPTILSLLGLPPRPDHEGKALKRAGGA
jgi:predicted AlkP superfamily phosphohydrolase/phosphomutase